MESFHEYIDQYKKQLKRGDVKKAYKGLMEYFHDLKTHLNKKYPGYFLSSSIHYGFMDITYFYFIPNSLKQRKLKVIIVFIHYTFTFQIWLAGYNKKIQTEYWKLFTESGWKKYSISPNTKGVDSIINHTLIEEPDFSDLRALTRHIEKGAVKFIKDIDMFLSKH